MVRVVVTQIVFLLVCNIVNRKFIVYFSNDVNSITQNGIFKANKGAATKQLAIR